MPPTDILTERAEKILQLLGIPLADTETLRRARGFIRCNGYEGVLAAAGVTRDINRQRRQRNQRSIQDTWGYTRTVFNRGIGYSSLLYNLLHLVETSLRSWVDNNVAAVRGADWHLHLNQLMGGNLSGLADDLARVEWDDGRPRGATLQDFQRGGQLIEHLSFGTLRTLILANYGARPFGLQLRESNRVTGKLEDIPPNQISALLNQINRDRNRVMHHRPVSANVFTSVATRADRFLRALEFDIHKTVQRTELARHLAGRQATYLAEPMAETTREVAEDLARLRVQQVLREELAPVAAGDILVKGIAIVPAPNAQVLVAVASRTKGIDAVRSCLGEDDTVAARLRVRLDADRLRLIEWDGQDIAVALARILDPVPVLGVQRDEATGSIVVRVPVAHGVGLADTTHMTLAARLVKSRLRLLLGPDPGG